MSEVALRASLSGVDEIDDPSPDQIRSVIESLERGDEEFLIVERVSGGQAVDGSFVQVAHNLAHFGGFVVERRDDASSQQVSTSGHELARAVDLVLAWCWGQPLPPAVWVPV